MRHLSDRLRLALGTLTLLAFSTAAGATGLAPELMNLAPGSVVAPGPAGTWDAPGSHLAPEGAATFDFPSNDSAIVGSVGFIDGEQVGYFWSVLRGDSVTEAFSGPASITSYELHVDVIENALSSGAFVRWNVIINGVTVDSFTVNQGFLGTVNRATFFPAIAGPNYAVELRVTNEVANGEGSHTFRYAGAGNFQIVLGNAAPPPSLLEIPTVSPLGMALLALLLSTLGLWLLRRRRAV